MIEHALWESLTTSVGAQIGSEAEGFVYGKVRFNYEQRIAPRLLLFEHVTSPTIQHAVDTTDRYLRALRK